MRFFTQKQRGHLLNLFLGIVMLFPFELQAVVQLEELPEDLPPKPSFIDIQRYYVAEKIADLAGGIDSFFGNDRNFRETNKSLIQIDATRVIQHGATPNIAPSIKAKLNLPNAQKRFHLVLESNPDQNLPGLTPAQQLQQQRQRSSVFKEVSSPDSYGAAIRFDNSEDSPYRLSADGGLKLDNISIHPFARSSGSYTIPLDWAQLKFTESLFWFNSTGAGENSLFEVDHHYSERTLLRSTSSATFLYENQNFSLHQDFSIFRTLNEDTSLLYQVSANGVSRPLAEVTEYVALMLYRRRIHEDWVFLELNPQLHYPQANDFQVTAQFIVRLEFMLAK
jgi:hypothetical protein